MSDLAGRRVGRYEVESLVKTFATDAVYVARDPTLERSLWFKVQNEVDGRAIGGPLLPNEATTLAALRHPGIVQVHDVGTVDGLFFLVLEHLTGGSLAQAFAAKSLRPDAVVHAVADAAEAAGFAHRRGFVHRSLGPSTIWFDAEGRVKLVGFSLAARVEGIEESELVTFIARTGQAAPEVLARDAEHIGPASDVWSLGATLLEGLTGEPPFTADDVHAMIGGATPPRARLASPPAGVPPHVVAACLRCLEADPAARFADGQALADALRASPDRPAGKSSRVFVSHSS